MLAADLPPESERLFTWRPNQGPQTRFLESSAYEVLYGGAAGGGKSESLIVAPLRWVHIPAFRGILFRRTFPELEKSLIDRSRRYYPAIVPGAKYNEQKKEWAFPGGAKIYFGHLEHDSSVYDHQSAEYHFLGFDELTHFTEKQYVYMQSRLRSTGGVPIRVRSGSNPGGSGHEWVLRHWGRWLDKTHPEPAEPGTVLYFASDDAGEHCVPKGSPGALARQFIPALLSDNPHVDQNDPDYRSRLMKQDRVSRAQLLDGDWMARPAAGAYFQRGWFRFVDVAPASVVARVRRWDLASTENGGDWTIGVLESRQDNGAIAVEDVVRLQERPAGVQGAVKSTAEIDPPGTRIVIPQDPGQAGVDQRDAYAKMLQGYDVRFERETGDKVVRAQPWSAQVEAGNVYLVRAAWNKPFIEAHEAFPDPAVHDDDVDAAAGAFNALVGGEPTASFGATNFRAPRRSF